MTAQLFAELEETLPQGARLFRGKLSLAQQTEVLDAVSDVLATAPPFRPQMPTGPYMINLLSNCGAYGWISDLKGYRYETAHPVTKQPWPRIPPVIRDCAVRAAETAGYDFEPDACLINIYAEGGKLNLHRDGDEADFSHPIVSLSLGNDAEFLMGGPNRTGKTNKLTLHSGDVLVFGGACRLYFHGVRRIRPGTSALQHPVLPENGRINLTLRRAK